MKTGLKVIDAMTRKPITVDPDMSAYECAKQMEKYHVGNVVVEEEGVLIGILTEQDLVYRVISAEKNPTKVKARNIMTTNPITISPDKDIFDAMVKMRDKNVRRLPVLDDNKLIGMLTMKDILKIEPQLFELIVDKIELREEARKPLHMIGEKEGVCELCGEYTVMISEMEGSMICERCRVEI